MNISGVTIAAAMYEDLKERTKELQTQGVIPQMAVILVGNNPSSVGYIKQKQQWAEYIGAKVNVLKYPDSITTEQLHDVLHDLNDDPTIHGIILQRPLPKHVNKEALAIEIYPEKDIDGFHPNSKFSVPVALAVWKTLEAIFAKKPDNSSYNSIAEWLQAKNIVVLGKGETAGSPIIELLHKHNIHPFVIDSKTGNRENMLKEADIIISAVGKKTILPELIKEGVVLIGVGIHEEEGKMYGDYMKKEITSKASYYTPTPGGIGPLNVAFLLDNLILAAESNL